MGGREVFYLTSFIAIQSVIYSGDYLVPTLTKRGKHYGNNKHRTCNTKPYYIFIDISSFGIGRCKDMDCNKARQ